MPYLRISMSRILLHSRLASNGTVGNRLLLISCLNFTFISVYIDFIMFPIINAEPDISPSQTSSISYFLCPITLLQFSVKTSILLISFEKSSLPFIGQNDAFGCNSATKDIGGEFLEFLLMVRFFLLSSFI